MYQAFLRSGLDGPRPKPADRCDGVGWAHAQGNQGAGRQCTGPTQSGAAMEKNTASLAHCLDCERGQLSSLFIGWSSQVLYRLV
jgi:hypothetical protein